MNNIALALVALVLSSSALVGCGSSSFHTDTPASVQGDTFVQVSDACSGVTLRQRLGSSGVTVDGVTYFCGSGSY